VNGTVRDSIPCAYWVGVDARSGPCVDIVCDVAQGLPEPINRMMFDGLVSVETLEHCEDWFRVLSVGWDQLEVNGFACVTAASFGMPRHEHPNDYWRFTMPDLIEIFLGHQIVVAMQYPATAGVIVRKLSSKPIRKIGTIAEAPKQ
jgi:hypothetical protein